MAANAALAPAAVLFAVYGVGFVGRSWRGLALLAFPALALHLPHLPGDLPRRVIVALTLVCLGVAANRAEEFPESASSGSRLALHLPHLLCGAVLITSTPSSSTAASIVAASAPVLLWWVGRERIKEAWIADGLKIQHEGAIGDLQKDARKAANQYLTELEAKDAELSRSADMKKRLEKNISDQDDEISALKKRHCVEMARLRLGHGNRLHLDILGALDKLTKPAQPCKLTELAGNLSSKDVSTPTVLAVLETLENLPEPLVAIEQDARSKDPLWTEMVRLTAAGRTFVYTHTPSEVFVDQYINQGQAVNLGPNAHFDRLEVVQQSGGRLGGEDLSLLAADLKKLREAAQTRASSAEECIALGSLAEAERAAESNDRSGVMAALKKSGRWALEVAQAVGVGLAVAALKEALLPPSS